MRVSVDGDERVRAFRAARAMFASLDRDRERAASEIPYARVISFSHVFHRVQSRCVHLVERQLENVPRLWTRMLAMVNAFCEERRQSTVAHFMTQLHAWIGETTCPVWVIAVGDLLSRTNAHACRRRSGSWPRAGISCMRMRRRCGRLRISSWP